MLQFLITIISGITASGPLFVIASGLTLIYGVMRVLNFAHAALYMLGAYFAVQISGGGSYGLGEFVLIALACAAIVGVIGLAIERLVFRPLYQRPPEITLLASFGLSLLIVGLVQKVWGTEPRTQPLPPALDTPVHISKASISLYSVVEFAVAIAVVVLLILLLRKTRFGTNALAVAEDREMATVMGIRARRVSSMVFVLGSALAGLAGALIAPTVSVDVGLVPSTLISAFAVVVMGGLGTIGGAAIAALAVGLAQSIATSYAPTIEPYSFVLLLAVFLLFRPQGILGRRQLGSET